MYVIENPIDVPLLPLVIRKSGLPRRRSAKPEFGTGDCDEPQPSLRRSRRAAGKHGRGSGDQLASIDRLHCFPLCFRPLHVSVSSSGGKRGA